MSGMDFYMEDRSGEKKPVGLREISRNSNAIYNVEFQGENVRSKVLGGISGVEVLLLANCHRPEYNKAIVTSLYDERKRS